MPMPHNDKVLVKKLLLKFEAAAIGLPFTWAELDLVKMAIPTGKFAFSIIITVEFDKRKRATFP